MKPALIFNQYIWIINTFKTYGKLTLAQLDQMWREAKVAEGNPLPRSSFNRHRVHSSSQGHTLKERTDPTV